MRTVLAGSLRSERNRDYLFINSTSRRNRRLPPSALAVLFALATMLGSPCVGFADRWYEDFERAVELIGDGNCSREALQLLGAAVVDKPRPRLSARTIALRTVNYLPYYQLARAHLACGDADSTRYYLDSSREKGVAPANLLNELEQQLAELEAQAKPDTEPEVDPEELAGRVRTVTETIRQARSLAGQVESRRADRRFSWYFQDNSGLLERASAELRDAEEKLNEGTLNRDLGAIDAASAIATRAVGAYSDISGQLIALEQITPTAVPVIEQPSPRATPVPALPSPTAVVARPTPRPTAIGPDIPRATRPSQARPVPAPLRRAAAGYLRGEYGDVVDLLRPRELSGEREQAAAFLLRAAAHFAMYCLAGRDDEERLGSVRQDLVQWRNIDDSLLPDPRFFSPEFVALSRGLW